VPATLEQLPPDVGLIAMIAWSEVFTRMSRDFEALMKRWTRDGLKDDPADASDSLGRVEELAQDDRPAAAWRGVIEEDGELRRNPWAERIYVRQLELAP